MNKKQIKIAISGLNNTDNPAPGIGVAKSLKELGKNYELIGLSYDINEPGIYQKLFSKIYMMPYPSLGKIELIERLKYIVKENNGIDILIPNLDAELPLYIKYKNEIEKLGIKLLLPNLESFELRDKTKLDSLSKELGIKSPETYIIKSLSDLKSIAYGIGFPFVIKGKYYKAYKVNNLEEAIKYYYDISNEWGFPLLIQKIVSGTEINFVGIGNGEKLMGGVGAKKLTSTKLGKFWTGISINNKQLNEIAEKFVKLSKWSGPFEIEAIMSDKEIYLIEINPRFPAWLYFSTQLGINLPKMLVNILNKKNIYRKSKYKSNKLYIRYVEETLADFEEYSTLLNEKELKLKKRI